MTLIPGGTTFLGSPVGEGDADEQPQHQVTLPSYCLDTTEVTVAAYRACATAGACPAAGSTVSGYSPADVALWSKQCNGADPTKDAHPVNCVDVAMAEAFCKHAGKRLPTEAEWEYAARGGSEQRKYPWGNDEPSPGRVNACGAECAAWYASQGRTSKTTYPTSDGHATTAPVGSFPAGANRWGVLDLAGNVWEWTSTPYTKRYDIQATAADTARVLRGGGWVYGNPSILRAAIRDGDDPSNRYVILGFRCAR